VCRESTLFARPGAYRFSLLIYQSCVSRDSSSLEFTWCLMRMTSGFESCCEVGSLPAFQLVGMCRSRASLAIGPPEHGVEDMFSTINTNPAEFQADGSLFIGPHHDAPVPHGCDLSPVNMDKCSVLRALGLTSQPATAAPAAAATADRRGVFYVGDGSGDLCAVLSLGRYATAAGAPAPHCAQRLTLPPCSVLTWSAQEKGSPCSRSCVPPSFLGRSGRASSRGLTGATCCRHSSILLASETG
jgi:hypothetical protein